MNGIDGKPKIVIDLRESDEDQDKMLSTYIAEGDVEEISNMLASLMIQHPEVIKFVTLAAIKATMKRRELVRDN